MVFTFKIFFQLSELTPLDTGVWRGRSYIF